MDIKLQKKPWLVRHKYYVAGGVLFAALAVYTLVLQCSPARQRVSAGALGIARVPYDVWFRFFWKFIVLLIAIGFVLLIPTVTMQLNGF